MASADPALRSNQFRLAFVGCVVALVAFTLAGMRGYWFLAAVQNPYAYDATIEFGLFVLAPTLAAAVLLLGRGVVVVPMAGTIFVAAALACVMLIGKDLFAAYGCVNLCLPLASEVGLLWLLRQRVSVPCLVVAIVNSALLGAWLTAFVSKL